MNKNPYYRHRFPAEIISHCVWLYNSFSLNYRDIEKMMLYRGIEVTYESVRDWVDKFSDSASRKIRKSRPKASDKWHLDGVRMMIKGEEHWLWRAVDSEDQVLDILIQKRRDAGAAENLMLRLLKKQGFIPRVIVTNKLKSYGAAFREMGLDIEHRQHKGLNNQVEQSPPMNQAERAENAPIQVSISGTTISFPWRDHLPTNSASQTQINCRRLQRNDAGWN